MILIDYLPLYVLREIAQGEGWFPENIDKIPKKKNNNKDVETTDVELVKRYGDLVISRGDGDIYLPNAKVILGNDVILYYGPNELPYPSVVFSGYERMDVRDPYYTSPLIKLSPMQKLASQLANKYLDCVWLNVEPPGIYDGNDPQFVLNGGPRIAPGAQTAAKAEIRTSEFVDKQERHALRPYLYMQHEFNKLYMDSYEFYNPEMDAPDFMRADKSVLPAICQFEVVGSRGVLGEKNRMEKKTQVTAFASGDPGFSPLLNRPELLKDMYQDAGEKQPERLILTEQQEDPEALKQ